MELKTGDFIRLCGILNITKSDLDEINQPSQHMKMAEAVYKELSLLDFEQVQQLVGNNDDLILIRLKKDVTLLELSPNSKLTPGNGLPTINEQLKKSLEATNKKRKEKKLDKIRTNAFDARDSIKSISSSDNNNIPQLRNLSKQIVNIRNDLNNFNDSIKGENRSHMNDELEWLSLLTERLSKDINKILEGQK